jgi:hypothetical protein
VPAKLTASQRTPGFLLPGLGALASLVILLVGTQERVGIFPVGFAAATLSIVGVRVWFSMLRLRQLTDENQRQSVTNKLPGWVTVAASSSFSTPTSLISPIHTSRVSNWTCSSSA